MARRSTAGIVGIFTVLTLVLITAIAVSQSNGDEAAAFDNDRDDLFDLDGSNSGAGSGTNSSGSGSGSGDDGSSGSGSGSGDNGSSGSGSGSGDSSSDGSDSAESTGSGDSGSSGSGDNGTGNEPPATSPTTQPPSTTVPPVYQVDPTNPLANAVSNCIDGQSRPFYFIQVRGGDADQVGQALAEVSAVYAPPAGTQLFVTENRYLGCVSVVPYKLSGCPDYAGNAVANNPLPSDVAFAQLNDGVVDEW